MELNELSVFNPSNVNTSQDTLNMTNFQIIEERPQVSQSSEYLNPKSTVSQDFSMKNLQIVDEGPRLCPLCAQEIRTYFINYSEKIEMCENLECDYPFGYEPLRIMHEENGVQTIEVKSVTSKGSRSVACSQASSQGWSDVDKLCNVFDTEEVPSMDFNKLKTVSKSKKTESERRRAELLENVEKIKQMTKSMNDMKKESKRVIKNEKWIKNLQYLQGLSGVNLLKPAEMKKIRKKALARQSGELKIDIDKNNLSSIKIEVNHAGAPSTRLV